MSNRFHTKWHRRNHHTYGNANNPDASHDPIASPSQPFLGDFSLQGALCAVAPLSSYAGYFYSNFTAISAYGGQIGEYAYGGNIAGVFSSPVIALSTVYPSGDGYPNKSNPYFGPNYISKNVLNNRTGIFTENPLSAFHVTGGTYLDGHCTITGNLSVNGDVTRLDTYVYITSSTQIVLQNNSSQSPALLVSNTGDTYILQAFDGDYAGGLPALVVDGHNARPGYVGLGTKIPANTLSVSSYNPLAVGTLGTYAANFSNYGGAQGDVNIGSDGTYGYIQSGNSKALQLNGTGNNTLLNSSGSGNVGIGTTAPAVKLDVNASTATPQSAATGTVIHVTQATSSANRLLLDSFASRSSFTGRSAQGTATTPTASQTGDVLAEMTGQGYGATTYGSTSLGRMTINAAQNWTDAAQGTYLTFQTTPIGSTTPTERVRITDSGYVGINTTAPAALLDINGSVYNPQPPPTGTTIHVTQTLNTSNVLLLDSFNITNGSSFTGRSARGSILVPSNVLAGDVLAQLEGQGYAASAYSDYVGKITINAAQTFSSNSTTGSFITFQTTPIGSTTPTERVRITDSGNVGIGTQYPTNYLLAVSGTAGFGGMVTLLSGGNVYGPLTVYGSVSASSVSAVNVASSTSIFAGGMNATNQDGVNIDYVPGVGRISVGNGTGADSLAFYANGPGTSTPATTMYLSNAGNVGINTSSPSTMLTVAGPISLRPPVSAATNYTVLSTDSTVIVTVSTGLTLTLATNAAAANYPGRQLYVLNRGSGGVAGTISTDVPILNKTGSFTKTLLNNTAGYWALLHSDGTLWNVIATNNP